MYKHIMTEEGTFSEGAVRMRCRFCRLVISVATLLLLAGQPAYAAETPPASLLMGVAEAAAAGAGVSTPGAVAGAAAMAAPDPSAPIQVRSLTVAGSAEPLLPGRLRQFTASAGLEDGTVLDVTDRVLWFSQERAVASVGADGTATGLAPGKTAIVACTRGFCAMEALTVVAPVSFSVSEARPIIGIGAGTELKASAIGPDGGLYDVTAEARWRSDNPEAATVEKGRVTGVAAGTALIVAEYGGFAAQTAVKVQPVTGLAVTPGDLTLKVNDRITLKATATFADGTGMDVSGDTRWRSSKSVVAGVFEGGLVVAYGGGDAVVTAAYGAATARTAVQVLRVERLEMDGVPGYLLVGQTATPRVWVTFAGGTRLDLTAETRWRSSDPAVVQVSEAGLITAVGPGKAWINAQAGGGEISVPIAVGQ